MKVKKQKKHRKIVTFYTSCFGFRKPFKVLCDGTFVHHLLSHKITPADDAIANILNSNVKLFTTRSVFFFSDFYILEMIKFLASVSLPKSILYEYVLSPHVCVYIFKNFN